MKKSKLALWGFGSLIVASGVLATALPPNLDATLKAQRKLVEARPNDAVAFNDLGNLLEASGDLAGAEEAYQKAISLDPQAVAAHFNLALLYQQQNKDKKAIHSLEQLLEIEPSHAWAHYQLGVSLEKKGRRGAAVEQYAQAFALDTGLSFPRNNPQILDSRVATEGLLRAEAYLNSQANRVPRQFNDTARIRKMMLGEPSAAAAKEGAVTEEVTKATPPPEEGTRQRPAAASSATGGATSGAVVGGGEPANKVITNEDLKSSGGATGSRNSRSRGTAINPRPTSTFATPSGGAVPSYTQIPQTPPVSNVPNTVPTRPSDTGALPPIGVYVPPPENQQPAAGQPGTPAVPDRFRPARRSTASLSWEIEPSAPAAG